MRSYCRILTFVMIAIAHGHVYNDDTVMKLDITNDNSGNCDRADTISVRKLAEEDMCQPRQRLITLKLNNSDRMLTPSQILAYRCDRDAISSGPNYVCSAKERVNRTITVQASYGLRNKKCLTVQVSDDTKCAFQCSLMPTSCKEGQYFSQENCECICQNWQTKKQECERRRRSWNGDDCSCNCKNTHPCPSSREWSEEICDCRRHN